MSKGLVCRFAISLLAFNVYAMSGEASHEAKPNILLIVSDDLSMVLGSMGHAECKTPHLDRFAQSAVSFKNAFCQFPLCAPSRASMLTGQYPMRNGVVGNGGNVQADRITLPRHFANHGYWTARVSKIYHMGIPSDIVEGNSGRDHPSSWDETYDIKALEALTPGKAEDFLNPESVTQYPAERKKWLEAQNNDTRYHFSQVARAQYASIEVAEDDQHLLVDKLTTDRAIDLLQQRAQLEQPFFLAVGLVRPHFPFIGTEETMGQYDTESIVVPDVPVGDHKDIPKVALGSVLRFDERPIQKMRRAYFGAVSFMDRQVGRLIDELDRLSLRDDTIVVFVSDHGYLLGEHHMWKKARLWEEAIHVPLMISAPGRSAGTVCDHFVELVDLYPTLSRLAGLPDDPGVQGQSIVPLLDDPKTELARKDALIQVSKGFGLRSGRWAYMWYPKSKKTQSESYMLYDLQNDPQQYTNLAESAEHADVRLKLHQRLVKRVEDAAN